MQKIQKFNEIIKPGTNIDFIGIRKWAYLVSILVVLISVISLIHKGGVKLGVDFASGVSVQIRLTGDPEPEVVREALTQGGITAFNLQSFGVEGQGEFLINMKYDASLDLDTIQAEIMQSLVNVSQDKPEIRRMEVVSSKVGHDMRQKALYAILYSILMIAIYISGRFETKWGVSTLMVAAILGGTWLVSLFGLGVIYMIIIALIITLLACFKLNLKFALGAIIAIMHDVVATVGLFSILDKEINLAIVAALLTVLGYSLNDSIIIFDRIRENIRRTRKQTFAEIVNNSINETLSRTVLTSGTTIFVVLSLYLLGGPVNKDFALALLFGIAIGTFSSIFVSAPILLIGDSEKLLRKVEEEENANGVTKKATSGAVV